MKPTESVTILVGAPVEGKEAQFLRTLARDLAGSEALILANFQVGGRQVDFVVVRPRLTALLELKNLPGPIFGNTNGDWSYEDAVGHRRPYPGNPYVQTVDQKMAVSDAMRTYQGAHTTVSGPRRDKFFKDFQAFVCVYPAIHPSSQVTAGDVKAHVRSYPEILLELRDGSHPSTWTIGDWRRFAQSHLNLAEKTLDQATDPRIDEAQQRLRAYRERVVETRANLPPLVGGGAPHYGKALIDRLREPHNFLVTGPMGSTKTFHLDHLASALAQHGELPLILRAGTYQGGPIWDRLEAEAAAFAGASASGLPTLLTLSGLPPTLLIDALNECPARHLGDLFLQAQAFILTYGGRLVATAQPGIDVPASIVTTVVPLTQPTDEHKRAIYAHHARIPAAPELDQLLAGFTNAYDLTVAGRCHGLGAPPASRSELYDRYVLHRLGQHPAVLSALLRELAHQMAASISMAERRDAFDRSAEQFLKDNGAPLASQDALRESGLLTFTNTFVTFEHEALFDYFKADDLWRRTRDLDALLTQLRRPRHQDAAEFLLPRFADPESLFQLFRAINDLQLLCRVAKGYCGHAAEDALLADCERLMDDAVRDLSNLRVELPTVDAESGRRLLADVMVRGQRAWSAYDKGLCYVIAHSLDNARLGPRFLDLLDRTEATLRGTVTRAAHEERFRLDQVWSEALRIHGGILMHGTMSLPCTEILGQLRSSLMHRRQGSHPLWDELSGRALAALSDMALVALLEDPFHRSGPEHLDDRLQIATRGLQSTVSFIRMQAMHSVHDMAAVVRERAPERVPELLRLLDFESDNVFDNTIRLEALAALGALELDLSTQDALDEMRALIAPSRANDPALVELAAHYGATPEALVATQANACLGRIFEDVFQGLYMDAYDRLTDDEKRAILRLAALDTSSGFMSDWVLKELLSYDHPSLLPVYQRFAERRHPHDVFPQEAAAAFVLGVQGFARHSDVPPTSQGGAGPVDQAWDVLGNILYRVFRHAPAEDLKEALAPLWKRLEGDSRLALGEALYSLKHSSWRFADDGDPLTRLLRASPDDLRSLLEYCLAAPSRVVITPHVAVMGPRELFVFYISTLTKVGNDASIALLQGIVDDSEIGPEAIQAIESLQKQRLARSQ